MVTPTTYKPVTYEGKGNGTLKLYDNQLTFSMFDINSTDNTKIFTLPWKKVKKRQVTNSDQVGKPKMKLILKSGSEQIFLMEDRISLEVLRDDVADRLSRYKAQYPDSDDEAVNQTRKVSPTRESTPYRMAKPSPPPTAKRESQPYRMAKPAPPATQKRESQPYRMAKPSPPPASQKRESQPYRMAKKEPPKPRESQPYRYVAK